MMTEAEQGRRDILNWLAHNSPEDIAWKIQVTQKNYPHDSQPGDKPYYRPYYDAVLEELRRAQQAYEHAQKEVPEQVCRVCQTCSKVLSDDEPLTNQCLDCHMKDYRALREQEHQRRERDGR